MKRNPQLGRAAKAPADTGYSIVLDVTITTAVGLDPAAVCLFVPPGLKKFKLDLFERVALKVGRAVHHDYDKLAHLSDDLIPVVGCTPELRPLIDEWIARKRKWIYWDRGYARRVFATWLPRGENGGYYRWHLGSYQMQRIQSVPKDRWDRLDLRFCVWQIQGQHIVLAEPSATYQRFHRIEGWTEETIARIKHLTSRPIIRRDKECRRSLQQDLVGAHALVTHGSIAAVEAVLLGCPVFVDRSSAAALVGHTDLSLIESPVRPDRSAWVHALAYSQFNEAELVDGTLWSLIS